MMMGEIAIGEVLEVLREHAHGAVGLHGLVDVPRHPPRAAAIVETQLIVGIPVRRPNPSPKMPGHPRDSTAGDSRVGGQRGPDFSRELRRDALVGIDRQNPVVRRLGCGEVLLLGVAWPVADDHARAGGAGAGDRVVRAAAVNHQHLGRPGDRRHAGLDVGGFVARDDRDGHRRHGRRL
jgi:hypothetical protein